MRSGTRASSARLTIGASVPSMSQKIPACPGASVTGRSASVSMSAAWAGTARSMQRVSPRLVRLAAIGTAAGAFSGLFGVGGGTVIVPLLMLWLVFGEREATGTSLAAIALIATLAAIGHAIAGNVDFVKGVLIGLPAVAGVVAGVALQQRIPPAAVSGLFSLVLVASAAYLIF